MVTILTTVLTDGLAAVEAACAEALESGTHSADVILNTLARRTAPVVPSPVAIPASLTLTLTPRADCARYDGLRPPPPAPHATAAAVVTAEACRGAV